MSATAMEFDLFISHASEDKDAVVRPLTALLEARGHRIWLDELQIRLGDSLRRRIDEGLTKSRFGLVVLSPAFFLKAWPQWELDGLAQREMESGEKVVLPVWHGVGVEEVSSYSPSLAARRAARTKDGLDVVVAEIEAVFDATERVELGRRRADGPDAPPAALEPFLVLAPPSGHRLEEPHQVTPAPQSVWAQRAYVNVENVGGAVALIRASGADGLGVGRVDVRAPAAIAPGATRPVELIVNTVTEGVRISSGQLMRFWLDYGCGASPDRRLWATAQYLSGGGWNNLGYANRSLTEPERELLPTAANSGQSDFEQLLSRVAFASSEFQGSGVILTLRRWLGAREAGAVTCRISSHTDVFETEVLPRPAGGGWIEYSVRFPDDFPGAGVVAGGHSVDWRVPSNNEELATDEFRFP